MSRNEKDLLAILAGVALGLVLGGLIGLLLALKEGVIYG